MKLSPYLTIKKCFLAWSSSHVSIDQIEALSALAVEMEARRILHTYQLFLGSFIFFLINCYLVSSSSLRLLGATEPGMTNPLFPDLIWYYRFYQ
jgi:urea transporter